MEAIDTKQMLIDNVERFVSELENLELGELAGWWGADEVRRYLDSVDAVNEYYTEQFAGSLIKA